MSYNSGDIVSGKYRIIDVIGGGAMGVVYRAQHEAMDIPVALKVLHGDYAESEEFRHRFKREARAAAMLKHPNICMVSDFSMTEDEKAPYLVMELLEGETLKNRMTRLERFSAQNAVLIMRQLCSALYCAHQSKIVHRDVKPDNVFLIERDGSQNFVKLIDFGIAHLDKAEGDLKTLTQSGQIYGTPQYLSPEQALGDQIDFRADLYACGVILYEMLVGEPPFEGKNYIEVLHKQISELPPHLPDDIPHSQELDTMIQRLLQKDPANRYESALEVIKLLDQLIEEFTAENVRDASSRQEVAHARLGSLKLSIIVGCALFGIIILSFWGMMLSKPEASSEIVDTVPTAFQVSSDKFEVSFDTILSQDRNIVAATQYYNDEKYEIAYVLLDVVRTQYWEHPNFVRLYMQACRKARPASYKDKLAAAGIQMMRLSEDACRNAVVRQGIYDSYEKVFSHPDFHQLSESHRALNLSELILHSPYDMGRNRLSVFFDTYDAQNGQLKTHLAPWVQEAIELWRIPADACGDRLASLEQLLQNHKDHTEDIYAYVIYPFYESHEKNCGKKKTGFLEFEKKKVDCNDCMRSRLKELVSAHESEHGSSGAP